MISSSIIYHLKYDHLYIFVNQTDKMDINGKHYKVVSQQHLNLKGK